MYPNISFLLHPLKMHATIIFFYLHDCADKPRLRAMYTAKNSLFARLTSLTVELAQNSGTGHIFARLALAAMGPFPHGQGFHRRATFVGPFPVLRHLQTIFDDAQMETFLIIRLIAFPRRSVDVRLIADRAEGFRPTFFDQVRRPLGIRQPPALFENIFVISCQQNFEPVHVDPNGMGMALAHPCDITQRHPLLDSKICAFCHVKSSVKSKMITSRKSDDGITRSLDLCGVAYSCLL
mmetsp:Transcript_37250/g.86893  ORF Transcript_37250/g.86893 Transcript_37250/m.86893 type:complete len:237 (-) Transcript_37250:1665-2375(-)